MDPSEFGMPRSSYYVVHLLDSVIQVNSHPTNSTCCLVTCCPEDSLSVMIPVCHKSWCQTRQLVVECGIIKLISDSCSWMCLLFDRRLCEMESGVEERVNDKETISKVVLYLSVVWVSRVGRGRIRFFRLCQEGVNTDYRI